MRVQQESSCTFACVISLKVFKEHTVAMYSGDIVSGAQNIPSSSPAAATATLTADSDTQLQMVHKLTLWESHIWEHVHSLDLRATISSQIVEARLQLLIVTFLSVSC